MTTNLIACAILDIKADIFALPFCTTNEQTAIRSFSMELQNEESLLSRFPADYHLMALGHYDQKTGLITPLANPKLLITGAQITMIQQRQIQPSDPELQSRN